MVQRRSNAASKLLKEKSANANSRSANRSSLREGPDGRERIYASLESMRADAMGLRAARVFLCSRALPIDLFHTLSEWRGLSTRPLPRDLFSGPRRFRLEMRLQRLIRSERLIRLRKVKFPIRIPVARQ